MEDVIVEMVSIGDLTTYDKNSRTHNKEQVHQLANSIKEFGFTNPILIDEDGVLIAGHGRLEASRLLNIVAVPAIRLKNLSEEQKKALRIADNKLALNAGWDEELLKLELEELKEFDFNLDLIGFSDDELKDILEEPPLNLDKDDSDEDEEYLVQLKFRTVDEVNRFLFSYKDRISSEFKVTLSVKGVTE